MAKRKSAGRSTTSTAASNGALPEWAVYIYMKPDQALEEFAERDLAEMTAGVTGADFPVVVHVDQERDVQRLLIANGDASAIDPTTWRAAGYRNRAVDPKDGFDQFLQWAMVAHPGRRRFVVLWGHSRGIGIDLAGPAAAFDPLPDAASSPASIDSGPSPDGLRLEKLLQVGTALPRSPSRASGAPGRTIDVLGLDSCYMSSAEFARQLQDRVGFLVAAGGAVKRTGWNYRVVLGALTANPQLTPEALADGIVAHVDGLDGDVSLARLDLGKSIAMTAAFGRLVKTLQAAIVDPDEAQALLILLKRTSYYQVRQFLDLRDLCQRLRTGFDGAVRLAAGDVLSAYEAMTFSRATGAALGRLNGLSIYCPLFQAQRPFGTDLPDVDAIVDRTTYDGLDFVQETGWVAMCQQLERGVGASRI
jgi:hypothetical protein